MGFKGIRWPAPYQVVLSLAAYATRYWNYLNGVFLLQTGRPLRSLSFREALDLSYAHITRDAKSNDDFERYDRLLAGTPRPDDFPQDKQEKLRPTEVDIEALDRLSALHAPPNIDSMTEEAGDD